MAQTTDSPIKKAADTLKKIGTDGINYTYEFDWFSVAMMGIAGVACVVIVTMTKWYLNRKT
jgi:hypothetical protein